MPVFTDQIENYLTLSQLPQRIVSIVPSQTELLSHLGLDSEVIGITKFCIHPGDWFRNKTRVGGTKQLKIDLIRSLQPDLVIANKEENIKEQVEEIRQFCPVWTSDVNDLASALDMIQGIGNLVNRPAAASELADQINNRFSSLLIPGSRARVAYFIWQQPFMAVGGDTFINAMLEAAGFVNILKERSRYPEVTVAELVAEGIDCIFLSSEPFPFKEKHREQLQLQYPGVRFELVDGEMFSWYGSRLLQAPAYFQSLRESIR